LGSSTTFTASASETGGTIASVSYYINSTPIGTSTAGSPYSLNWTPPTYGNFTFTAIASDFAGNTSYLSSPVTVQVPYDSDSNGLPDWWELKYFGHLGNLASSSPDGNSYTLLQAYGYGLDPTNYYSQLVGGIPGIINPALTIISGNNQNTTPGAFTDGPLLLQVTNSSGGATLVGAPVTFNVASGGGLVSSASGALGTSLSLTTDSSGFAQVFYQQPAVNNTSSTITAATGGQVATFTESTSVGDGSYDAPTNAQATPASPTEIDLSWVNHATTATSIIIQQSTDNVTWSTIATLTDPTATTYPVTSGLSVGTIYYFRVYGQK